MVAILDEVEPVLGKQGSLKLERLPHRIHVPSQKALRNSLAFGRAKCSAYRSHQVPSISVVLFPQDCFKTSKA